MDYKIVGKEFRGNRSRPILIVDWDDTIGSLAIDWVQAHNNLVGSTLTVEDLTTWDFPSIMGPRVYDSLALLDPYHHFKPYDGIVEALRELEKYVKIIIVTAAKTAESGAAKIKLSRNLFPDYEVWTAESKQNIRAFAIWDDNPATALSAKEAGILTVTMKHPWHNTGVIHAYDYIGESYINPNMAIKGITQFLITALKNSNKPKIQGTRYNAGKPAFDLIPIKLLLSYSRISMRKKPPSQKLILHLARRWRIMQQKSQQVDQILLYKMIDAVGSLAAHDAGQQDAGLYATSIIAKILAMGAIKYEPRNWERGLPFVETWASAMRHLSARFMGEKEDSESHLPHLGHALCNFSFLLHFTLNYEKYNHFDDR